MKKRLIHAVLSLLITVLMLYAVVKEVSWKQFVELLLNVNLLFLGAYAFLSLSALFLRALRYCWMLEPMLKLAQPVSYGKLLVVTSIRNALVDFFPARLGELSYFYVLTRYGVRVATGLSSFGLCLILDIVALIFIVLSVFLLGSFPIAEGEGLTDSGFSLAGFFAILAAGLFFCMLLIVWLDTIIFWVRDRLASLANKKQVLQLPLISRFFPVVILAATRVASDVRTVNGWRALGKLFLVTVALRAAKYGSLYLLLLAVVDQWNVGVSDIGVVPAFVAFVSAEAAASLPISGLMGFGAYEGAWSIVFETACGVSCRALPAISIALAAHVITQVFGYSIGILGGVVFLMTEVWQKPE